MTWEHTRIACQVQYLVPLLLPKIVPWLLFQKGIGTDPQKSFHCESLLTIYFKETNYLKRWMKSDLQNCSQNLRQNLNPTCCLMTLHERISVSFRDKISFFASLKNLKKNMNFIFCKLKKTQKTWISFFESLKNSKNMNFIFWKLKKPQKTWISFFESLKNLKKHEFHFLQA